VILHVYRSSADRWHDLRAEAMSRGAALASNALTLTELVHELTPTLHEATPGQRLVLASEAAGAKTPVRYVLDAISELKSGRIRADELRREAPALAQTLEAYDRLLTQSGLTDPQDRKWLAASAVKESSWPARFESVFLHALYDLNLAEFTLLHNLIERLPEGGTVMLFNATANIKPTQFAEWTWQRFVHDVALADKTFPEFVRSSGPSKELLERLFIFEGSEAQEPLLPSSAVRVAGCAGRYAEIESIGAAVVDILEQGGSPDDIAIVVRHIETYGESIEDVFSRYGVNCSFETGVPLLRVPFIKYWIALLDLVSSARTRDAMSRVLGSAYHQPALTPPTDTERLLVNIGYIDRRHLSAAALAARQSSPWTPQLERFETYLNELERTDATPLEFLRRLQPGDTLTARDHEAFRTLCQEIEAVDALVGVVPFERFRRTVSEIAGLRTADRLTNPIAAAPPPGVPRVHVLPPQALGHRSYRWIFAPGFADGEIPAPSMANPLLKDELIETLNGRAQPRRLQTSRHKNRKEPLYLFLLLDSASERVTLTYPGSTLEGEAIHPSIYVNEILRHYGAKASELSVLPPWRPRTRGDFLRAVAFAWRADQLERSQAVELLGDDIVRRALLEQSGTSRADIGAGVLPVDVKFSPSELDKLAACPFVFLARHRLRLQASELPDFEVSPRDVGSLAHRILREFYSTPISGSEAEEQERMQQIVQRQLAQVDIDGQGPNSVIDPSLWRIRRPQLVRALLEYVKFAVRDAKDGYETLDEYLDENLPAASLGSVLLGGRPDHVAVRRSTGLLTGIRVDDFKYSAASSASNKRFEDSVQIPVYAHLAASALKAGPEVPIEGRYLLLRSPSTPVVLQQVDSVLLDEVRARIEGLVDKVRSGELHPAPAQMDECSRCDYRRLCRFFGS
jgi:RecB family exonuclease